MKITVKSCIRIAAITNALWLGLYSAKASEDKSATQSGVIQLPSAGGTVQKEMGSFALNANTGSSQFTLPFPTLPSRGSFKPQISLKYSQFSGDAGNGLGIGWSISTPSVDINNDKGTAITGFKRNGDFYNRVTFSGKRLVFLSASENGEVLKFQMEAAVDDIRITYHKAPFAVQVLGSTGQKENLTISSGFVVNYPDGRKLVFSGDAKSAEGDFSAATGTAPLVTRWPLSLELNPLGDSISYQYEKHGGRSYLRKVLFAGGKSEYNLDLLDTKSHLVSYQNSFRQMNGKLYSKLTASFEGDIHSQWCFAYIGRSLQNNSKYVIRSDNSCLDQAAKDLRPLIDENSMNVLDQLRMIYRFGGKKDEVLTEQTQRLPNIRFDYSSWTTSELKNRNLVYEVSSMDWAADLPAQNFELADLNMDSLVDIIRSSKLEESKAFWGSGNYKNSFKESNVWELTRPSSPGQPDVKVSPILADSRFHFADISGDSFVDVMEVEQGKLHIYLGDAKGDFTYLGRSVDVPDLSPKLFQNGQAKFMDLNLDGLTDIVTTYLGPNGKTRWRFFLNLSKPETNGGLRVNFGKIEKAFPFDAAEATLLSNRDTRLVDINGDKLPDLVNIRSAYKGFCIYENQGNILEKDLPSRPTFGSSELNDSICGSGQFVSVKGLNANDKLDTMWYVDLNGDGLVDFANMGERTDQLKVWLGFGDGTFLEDPVLLELNLRVQVGSDSKGFKSRVADLDGDGQSEILIFQKASGTEIRPVVAIDFNRSEEKQLVKANLLTTVEFDSGLRHDIRYSTSTDELIRDRNLGVETPSLHFPVVCAKQIVTSEGIPGLMRDSVQVTEIFYHRPYYDSINKKFLGFSEVEKVVYGDEFIEQGKSSQKSVYTYEKYYTHSEDPALLKLAGQLQSRVVYNLKDTPYQLDQGRITQSFDPKNSLQHSLSAYTQKQELPEIKNLLSCERFNWAAVNKGPEVWFIRKTEERKNASVSPQTASGDNDHECSSYNQSVKYAEFDEHNIPHQVTTSLKSLSGPYGVQVPAYSQVTNFDYDLARTSLAHLGILVSPSKVVKTVNGDVETEVENSYDEKNGLLQIEATTIFSKLQNVPAILQGFHKESRTLKKNYTYDHFGNISVLADALGVTETVQYDAHGIFPVKHSRIHGEDSTLNQVTEMQYEGERKGLMNSFKTYLGLTNQVKYDSLGRRTKVLSSDGAEQLYSYKNGKNGHPYFILTAFKRYGRTPPEGESAWIYKLVAHRPDGTQLAEMEDAGKNEARVTSYLAYNRNKNKVFQWTPFKINSFAGVADLNVIKIFNLGQVPRPMDNIGHHFGYDELGRLKMQSYPSGKVDSIKYFPWGKEVQAKYKDAINGEVKALRFDIGNSLGFYAIVEADGKNPQDAHITKFDRDEFGHLSSILMHGEKFPRELVYDTVGKLQYQKIPGLGERYYFYDASRGRLVVEAKVAEGENPELHVMQTSFDHMNRQTGVTVNGKPSLTFNYDSPSQTRKTPSAYATPIARPLGLVTEIRMMDANGLYPAVERLDYDVNGRLVHSELEMNDKSYGESYEYTLEGTIKRVKNPINLEGIYSLGPDMRLKSVAINHPSFTGGPEEVIENVTYNAKGRLEQIAYRKGSYSELSYDPETLSLSSIQSFYEKEGAQYPLQDLGIVANENGSINNIIDNISLSSFGHVGRTASFEYNWKDELVRSVRYDEDLRFDYTASGSFKLNQEFHKGELVIPATASTALIPVGSEQAPYEFNGFGQLKRSPKILETRYDVLGKLIMAKTKEATIFYGYAHDGKRLYKKIVKNEATASDKVSLYLFPFKSLNIGPKGIESFVFVGDSRLARMEHVTGKWFYYLKDHLGSSDYVMNMDGVPVEQMLYRPYGTELDPQKLSLKWKEHRQQSQSFLPVEPTHHRFTGEYKDDDTGLYDFGARYYDPKLGRFITPDPLFLNQPEKCILSVRECNLYQYATNNPIKFKDPTGTEVIAWNEKLTGDKKHDQPILDYRKEVQTALQKIDPSAKVDMKSGVVSFDATSTAGHAKGHELMDRIVKNTNVIDIRPTTGGNGISTTNGAVIKADGTPGSGAGSTVTWNPTGEFHAITGKDGTTRETASRPVHIGLGHELIHGDHAQRGVWNTSSVTYKGGDGNLHGSTQIFELRATGIGGYNNLNDKKTDVTENDLRKETGGLDPRLVY